MEGAFIAARSVRSEPIGNGKRRKHVAKRRGQNEGTISQRKDGRWEARLSLGYEGGKAKRKCFYGKTRREAQEKMTAAMRTHQMGLPVNADERKSMAVFLDDWIETVVKPSRRPKTSASYAQIVELHLKPDLGRIPVAKLTAQDIQRLLNFKINEIRIRTVKRRLPKQPGEKVKTIEVQIEVKLSTRTVQYIREVLRNALNQAVRWDLAPRNVAEATRPPQVAKHVVTPLNPEQAAELLNKASGHRHEALFSVALAVGLRLGEALGLRWTDIDLVGGTLTVNNQLQRVNKVPMLVPPKTRNGARKVVLPRFAIEAFQSHRGRQQSEDKPAAGDKWQETGFVFTSEIGTPLDDTNVRRTLRKLLKDAGLPQIRFHDLRHTCASLLLAQRVPARVVMEILGHSQISLTMNTYSHVMPTMEREAADLLDGLLQKSKKA
jgi:integrase